MVVNSSWGTKRNCPKCAAHFYDLNKSPATCPKCKYIYDATLVVRPRRGRTKKPVSVELAEERMLAAKDADDFNKKKRSTQKSASKEEDELSGFEEIEVDAGADVIEEVDEEIDVIDEVDEESSPSDDADDESIMEEMSNMEGTIVDTVDDVEDSEDEEEEGAKKKPAKSSGKRPRRK